MHQILDWQATGRLRLPAVTPYPFEAVAAAPVPWRVEKAEQILINAKLDKAKARQAAVV